MRVDDGNRIFEVLHSRFEIGHLHGHLRSVGRQLRAVHIEEVTELAELVALIEIELDTEFATTEPCQSAADDVDGPQQQL